MKDYATATYQFIIDYIEINQCSPTYREISQGLGCSVYTVAQSIKKLQRMGKIEFIPKSSRSIKVLGYSFTKNSNATEKITKLDTTKLSDQDKKDLTTLAQDFGLLERDGVQEAIATCTSYTEGQQYIMKVYDMVYMR